MIRLFGRVEQDRLLAHLPTGGGVVSAATDSLIEDRDHPGLGRRLIGEVGRLPTTRSGESERGD
jgi:hypothetical protein